MDEPTLTRSPSSSVGDYLKAIWEVAETGTASTKEIAERLSFSPASVTSMLGRLRKRGLVEYERYRGASLTEVGRIEAIRLIRRHRLIETFLLEHLGYGWDEVHEEAERLEHAVSDEFTERLAELLGHPERDPHGDPIPAGDLTLLPEDERSLGETTVGERVRISRVSEDAGVLGYLGERGLVLGEVLKVREVRDLDGVVIVEDEDGESYALGESLARSIFIQSASENGT